jgi:hypothetical protein
VETEIPALTERINGAVYVASLGKNPFSEQGHPNGSLLAMYVVAKAPDRGVRVKVAGRVDLNPNAGQITATVNSLPPLPYSNFEVRLREGQQAPLISPAVCGTYTTQAGFTPFSAANDGEAKTLQIENGIAGGPCPAGGVPPLKPEIVSGTQNNAAAGYSPFYLRLMREDGEQEITRFSTTMPPGLTGNLSGVPFCPDVAVEAARQATGVHEIDEPSCPSASEIGHTLVGAGVGSMLAWTPGKVYMAGPYNGAPFAVVAVTSAKVGPFDLGTVVVREALKLDPVTADVTVDALASDPIPHIIEGIVVHVRDIWVYITGPYEGAPFGLSIVNPAKAGPFDLENTKSKRPACDCLVVRAKIEVDPTSAALTVTSDTTGLHAIPTMIEGIPLQIKHVNVTVTRPKFTFNPSNCGPLALHGAISSSDGQQSEVDVPFQVTNCATLKFQPSLHVSTSGKTSRKNGASLSVRFSYPKAPLGSQANIRSVKVGSPKSCPSAPSRAISLNHGCGFDAIPRPVPMGRGRGRPRRSRRLCRCR